MKFEGDKQNKQQRPQKVGPISTVILPIPERPLPHFSAQEAWERTKPSALAVTPECEARWKAIFEETYRDECEQAEASQTHITEALARKFTADAIRRANRVFRADDV